MKIKAMVLTILVVTLVLSSSPAGAQVRSTKKGHSSFTNSACRVLSYASDIGPLGKLLSDADEPAVKVVGSLLGAMSDLSNACSDRATVLEAHRRISALKIKFKAVPLSTQAIAIWTPSITFPDADDHEMTIQWLQTSKASTNVQVEWRYSGNDTWFDGVVFSFPSGPVEDRVYGIYVLDPCDGIQARIETTDGTWLYSNSEMPESCG